MMRRCALACATLAWCIGAQAADDALLAAAKADRAATLGTPKALVAFDSGTLNGDGTGIERESIRTGTSGITRVTATITGKASHAGKRVLSSRE